MSLTDQEYHDNYSELVRHYIKQNSGVPDYSKFTLENDGTLTGFTITHWDYGFSEPDETTLKGYSLSSLQSEIHGCHIPEYTTTERDNHEACYCTLIWNSTTNQLQFYDGSVWRGVSLT